MVIITSIQIWITYNKIQLSANDVTMSKCHKPNPLEAVSFSLYSSAAPFLLHSSPTTLLRLEAHVFCPSRAMLPSYNFVYGFIPHAFSCIWLPYGIKCRAPSAPWCLAWSAHSFSLWSRVALYKREHVYPFYPLLTVFWSASSLWQL